MTTKKKCYVYKAMSSYYSSLEHARSALRQDGWSPALANKENIRIYKHVCGRPKSNKPGRLVSVHKL